MELYLSGHYVLATACPPSPETRPLPPEFRCASCRGEVSSPGAGPLDEAPRLSTSNRAINLQGFFGGFAPNEFGCLAQATLAHFVAQLLVVQDPLNCPR